MKKILAFLLFILFLILAWFSWNWYKETVVCCGQEPIERVQYGPLIFDCTSSEVITNDLWPEKKKEILSEQKSGKKLLLVAPYFGSESKEMAETRAKNVKALFTEIPSNDIMLDVRFGEDCESTKSNMLHELKYKWVTNNENVIEYLDKTMVFYEYDSDKEISNENVLKYFDELSTFLKTTGDKIMLTGHTDNSGTNEYNEELGLKRAEEYKAHLISLGVDEAKISTQSKGETIPLKPNDTKENRKMNRRVEIHIIE